MSRIADQDVTHRIRERAYAIWEGEGHPHGRALDHWLRAELEVADAPASARRPRTRRPAGTPAGTAKAPARKPSARKTAKTAPTTGKAAGA